MFIVSSPVPGFVFIISHTRTSLCLVLGYSFNFSKTTFFTKSKKNSGSYNL